MYIREIKIKHFGPIEQLHFQLSHNINIIEGKNAAGKTQLLAAIHAMFFGNEIINYNSKSVSSGNVVLQIALPQKDITLEYKYTSHSSGICVDSFEQLVEAAQINRNKLCFYFPDSFNQHKKVYSKEMIQLSYLLFMFLTKSSLMKNANILNSRKSREIIHVLQ